MIINDLSAFLFFYLIMELSFFSFVCREIGLKIEVGGGGGVGGLVFT